MIELDITTVSMPILAPVKGTYRVESAQENTSDVLIIKGPRAWSLSPNTAIEFSLESGEKFNLASVIGTQRVRHGVK